MIVWLAGYPRTGNTLARLILRDTMGLDTSSMYNEPEMLGLFAARAVPLEDNLSQAAYERLRGDDHLNIIKTHMAPVDDCPAIVTCRDGRDAIVSAADCWSIDVWHAVAGENTSFADWSTFYKAWSPLNAANRLLIRFEDLIQDQQAAAEKISQFLNFPILKRFENHKAEWAAQKPKVFTDHQGAWKTRMTDLSLDLFWRLHGDVMGKLGYGHEKGST